ncbi:hypothetical protein H0H93_006737 [Arthromyces matolae]|nr:hypothetical protein H0H93_006737 [Arthromyces matolae]
MRHTNSTSAKQDELELSSLIPKAPLNVRVADPAVGFAFNERLTPIHAEFGLPKFRTISAADKSHLWLAFFDIVALVIFVWQSINEAVSDPSGFLDAADWRVSSIRICLVMTIRQTCLLVVTSMTLLHVRTGGPVTFGDKQWMLWGPTLILTITPTTIAAVVSGTGRSALFVGLSSYTTMIAILSTVSFIFLTTTLIIIKRNLARFHDDASDSWPPIQLIKQRPDGTEDVDADIRDGASWITSNPSSRRVSISAWSFSTLQDDAASSPQRQGSVNTHKGGSIPSPPGSALWYDPSRTNVNKVSSLSSLPSPDGPTPLTTQSFDDPDTIRRDAPSALPDSQRYANSESQPASWLTSTDDCHVMVWGSSPSAQEDGTCDATSCGRHTPSAAVSGSVTPQLADARVLRGYGYDPAVLEAGKVWDNLLMNRIQAMALPYLIIVSLKSTPSSAISVLYILSITMSSPILAITLLCRSPIPIPSGLFHVYNTPSSHVTRAPSPEDTTIAPFRWPLDSKSCAPIVVEARRGGDVGLTSDAVDGKSKTSGVISTVLSLTSKLSASPPEKVENGETISPALIQNGDSSLSANPHSRSHSESSTQFSRVRRDSKTSSIFSKSSESFAYDSKIMVAQRHHSSVAQTLLVSGSSQEQNQNNNEDSLRPTTGTSSEVKAHQSAHLRNRSVSSIPSPATQKSIRGSSSPDPTPPSIPLPPTPPSVRAVKLASLAQSFSSGNSLGRVNDASEVDALAAGVLPPPFPGISKISERDSAYPSKSNKAEGRKISKPQDEFGSSKAFPPLEACSTPAPSRAKISGHKRNQQYFSLSSLVLGKDSESAHYLSKWAAEVREVQADAEGKHAQHEMSVPAGNFDRGKPDIVFGANSGLPNTIPSIHQKITGEPVASEKAADLNQVSSSSKSLGIQVSIPHTINTRRESPSFTTPPFSAASTVTLFEEFAAGVEKDSYAQSTPSSTFANKSKSKHFHPLQQIRSANKTSSPLPEGTKTSAICTFAQWYNQAVRPLTPKATSFQRKMYQGYPSTPDSKKAAPRVNLRPLTLLQDRDNNITASPMTNFVTRPLIVVKKEERRGTAPVLGKIVHMDPISSMNKNLKPLRLARSTSKLRAYLGQNEIHPIEVVGSPSTFEHTGVMHSFHRREFVARQDNIVSPDAR